MRRATADRDAKGRRSRLAARPPDGKDAFLLESIFRKEIWGFVSEPVSEDNERAVTTAVTGVCPLVRASERRALDGGTDGSRQRAADVYKDGLTLILIARSITMWHSFYVQCRRRCS